ncbi:helix-turn-helix domain-containing protein [Pseudofrankia sp. DC12]|uniref:helix-turn-helix domain-containing protein n=1 Tax=Pseudofrankia sp. DC12 TaxID=683315 RepID=UPI0009FE6539|nr:helix-turn-helix domain-containing protein [Pseudofrankia sp. DC12]
MTVSPIAGHRPPTAPPAADLDLIRAELRAVLARLDDLAAVQRVTPTRPATILAPDPTADLPPLVPVERAADLLGLSRSGAYRLAASGELPSRKLGGRVFIVTAGLRAILTPDGAAA